MDMDQNLFNNLLASKAGMEYAPVSIFRLDQNGNILEVNQKACKDLGYSAEELIGMTIFDIDNVLTQETWLNYLDSKELNASKAFESSHKRKDGSTFPVEILTSFFNFYGQTYSYSFVQNITNRKIVESQAMQNYARYRALAEASFEGIVITRDGVILELNDQFCDLYGYSRQEMINKPLAPLVAPEDRDRVLDIIKDEKTLSYSHIALRKDGTRFIVEVNSRPIIQDNQPVRVASIRDITQKINIEENLKKIVSQEKDALRIARMGHWEYDIKSTTFKFNDQIYSLLGTSQQEQGGYEIQAADYIRRFLYPEDAHVMYEVLQEALKTKDPDFRCQTEARVIRADGRVRYQIVWFKVGKNDFGETEKLYGVSQDITDLKEAEQEIHRLNSELEQRVRDRTAQLEAANKEMESFSYSISHDLRAPLRTLNGFSNILKEEYSAHLDPLGIHYLDRIALASLHMSDLIDGLLKISRISRANINYELVNLSELVNKIAQELHASEPERQVIWKIHPDITARVDKTLIQIVLNNLLGNSWKFSQKKAKTVIEFGQEIKNKEKIFFIKDNGAGFDMTYADKLFHEFERLHTNQEFEGTGIGLVIVYRIIHRHGGKVWAKGEPGKGATFYFTLDSQ